MSTIEVELRGWLPREETKKDFLAKISKEFGKYEYTRELVIFFRYEHDVRFKFINNQGEFILKKKLGNEANQTEWITRVAKDDIANFIFQLVHLGYENGLLSTGERFVFKKDGMELCLKYNTPIGDFFELEEQVANEGKVQSTEYKLKEALKNISLTSWDEGQYAAVKVKSLSALKKIDLLNKSKNGINEELQKFIFED